MSVSFPTLLPNPQVSYSLQNSGGVISSEFESGRVNQRNRFTSSRALVNLNFKLDYLQLAIFEGFVCSTLSNGALPFTIDLPDASNQAMTAQEVIIPGGDYSVETLAGQSLWSVSLTVLIQDKVTFDGAMVELLEIYDGDVDAAIAFANTFHEVVHITMPAEIPA